ncbi:hypothetical protein CHS0354_021861 [Potamilus streckersoni]|uniref:Uncharacterized protein n=1 Tax=Potamilus streckersoni TaxID=2493646 RepID=A0AAE0SEI8_9BIVA|nr:hypothetical protein CHS0354_021861 [Potamilus streckersoni]
MQLLIFLSVCVSFLFNTGHDYCLDCQTSTPHHSSCAHPNPGFQRSCCQPQDRIASGMWNCENPLPQKNFKISHKKDFNSMQAKSCKKKNNALYFMKNLLLPTFLNFIVKNLQPMF